MFRLQGVEYSYPGAASPVFALADVAIPAGRTTAVLGPSGLGKTTLLHSLALLAGDDELRGGSFAYTPRRAASALDVRRMSADARAECRRRDFGLMPQVPHLLAGFTCRANVLMGCAMLGVPAAESAARLEARLDDMKADAAFRGVMGRTPAQTSTGQRQRLSLLRAILHEPAVLFADEPVSNLDVDTRDHIVGLLRGWREADPSRTLVMVCHELDTAWALTGDDDAFLFLRKADGVARAETRAKRDVAADHGVADDAGGAAALRREMARKPEGKA